MSRRVLTRHVRKRPRWRPTAGVLLALALFGAACSGSGSSSGGSTGGGGAAPNAGVLVTTVDDEPETLDPAQVSSSDVGQNVIFQAYDRLVRVPAGTTDLAPSLSTKVPNLDNGLISKDGLTYTFPIRKSVKFQDGSALTAQDVKFSWDRVVTMDLPEGQAGLFSVIDSTKVVDKYTFRVTLKEPDAPFLRETVLSMPASILSEDAVKAHGGVTAGQPNKWMSQHTAGTGPYKLTDWARGDHMSFDVFKDYWGTPAHLPVRLMVLVKEGPTGLQAKKYDVISTTPQQIPEVQGIPDVKVNTKQLGLQIDLIGFNMKIDTATLPKGDDIPADFFLDPKVRQAFNYAFPHKQYIKGVLAGDAGRSSCCVAKGVFGYDPKAPIYTYDPAKAKQLFKETGWWNRGFTVSLLVDGTNDTFKGAALAMKDGIEKLNPKFHVQVLGVPEARFDEQMTKDPVPAAMWSYTSPALPSAMAYLYNMSAPNGRWGTVNGFSNGYTNPDEVANLIDKASRTLDNDRRKALLADLQKRLYEQAMWVLPGQEGAPVAYGSWMKNVQVNPMWPRPNTKWALYDK